MQLLHNGFSGNLAAGDMSDTLTVYFATGTGTLDDATALADVVTQEPKPFSVSAGGKMATAWGALKR